MLQKRQIVPGDPANSRIYIRTALTPLDPMPPKGANDALTDAEKSTLKLWIADGARTPQGLPGIGGAARKPVADADILSEIANDLGRLPSADRPFTRYFLLNNLANSGSTDADLRLYRSALSRLINGLSWERGITPPKTVGASGTIQRIDLRSYAWKPDTWQKLLIGYPYGVTSQSQTAKAIYQQTRCELPYIRTDWFVANAALPPLYHDLLDLPLTIQELERLLHVDNAIDLKQRTVQRSGFGESGVSRNNRVVERHNTPYGAYWRSFDFAGNSGKQNIFENPVTFEEAGGEVIFSLPNGLQAYMLVNSVGRRIDAAPIEIVSNKDDPHDPVVRNGLTCMSCHGQGVRRFDDRADQLRQVILTRSDEQNKELRNMALTLYSDKSEIMRLLTTDASRFAGAVTRAGSEVDHDDPTVLLAKRFNQPVSISQAAAELGISDSALQTKLNASSSLGALKALFAGSGGGIKRDAWEEYFSIAVQEAAHGGFNRPASFSALKQFSMQLNGVTYVADGAPEILTATFKQADGGVTQASYSGLVVLNVTGVGQAESDIFNDAFYRYTGPEEGHPRVDLYFAQLMFSTAPLQPTPADAARRRLVGPVPPYSPAHNYTFVLDTGLGSPGKLHFGVGDHGFNDNTGAYTIQIMQLRAIR